MSTARPVTYPLTLSYATRSHVSVDPAGPAHVQLALDPARGTVGYRARVKSGALFRDAWLTAAQVLSSDLRYRGRDRAAYLAYLTKQGKKATKEIWEAQKQFIDSAFADETKATGVLDPVLTVDPDEISLEVFSRDESSYARLALGNEGFDGRQVAHGTTFADLSPALVEELDRLRAYNPVDLEAGVALAKKSEGEQRSIDVPYAWMRGFLQVQSAATLPAVSCELAPVDLYNLLFALRTRKAKKSPRALRFELVPGAAPRMILEPWELVIEGHAGPYKGTSPRVVRTFGRQRLLALARLLPHVKRARVQLTGAGLPVFWVLELTHGATFTLALTGWTESGWSSAAAFDALMPGQDAHDLATKVGALLRERGPQKLEQITAATHSTPAQARSALQLEALRGRALFDLAHETYRPRDLLAQAVDDAIIRYGSEREARAHRLLGDGGPGEGEVKVTKLHDVAGEGVEIHGEVADKQAHRSYTPRFMLDLEGRTREAFCTCPTFRRAGMREGPCEHMIALRLTYARQRAKEEALRLTPEGRKTIRAETRTYVRRDAEGKETVFRVSLDDKLVFVRWGERHAEPRQQRLWYDTDKDARAAYFARLDALSADGFIDSDAGAA